jgi:hypothetical protein
MSKKPSAKPAKKSIVKPKAKPSAKPSAKPGKAKKPAAPRGRKATLDSRNGFTKPASSTSNTGRIWAIADSISTKQGRPAFRKEVMDKAISEGIKSATASSQYSFWRTYHGIVGKKAPGRAPGSVNKTAAKAKPAPKGKKAAPAPKAKPSAKPAAKPAKKPAGKPASKPKAKPAVAAAPVETPAAADASVTPETSATV